MNKNLLVGLTACVFFLCFAGICMPGIVQAALITVSTAKYNGLEYNLIWYHDSNGGSVMLSDNSNRSADPAAGREWIDSQDSLPTLNLSNGYFLSRDNVHWRIATTAGGFGHNQTLSSGGNLLYDEGISLFNESDGLTIKSRNHYWFSPFSPVDEGYAGSRSCSPCDVFQPWSGDFDDKPSGPGLSSGQVPKTDDVSEPVTLLIMGSCLLGLAGFRKKVS